MKLELLNDDNIDIAIRIQRDIFPLENGSEDLKEAPKFNSFNGKKEMDIGSCDRVPLLNCMLNGNYTESETSLGNYDCNEWDFDNGIEITYNLKTDCEVFDIHHKGVFINKTKTRAIIIQLQGSIY